MTKNRRTISAAEQAAFQEYFASADEKTVNIIRAILTELDHAWGELDRVRAERDRLFDWALGHNVAMIDSRKRAVIDTLAKMTNPKHRIDSSIANILAEHDRKAGGR